MFSVVLFDCVVYCVFVLCSLECVLGGCALLGKEWQVPRPGRVLPPQGALGGRGKLVSQGHISI